jgi:carbon storage regulator CsrA
MLVLSRREQETIVLPAIRTTIQLLKVRGQVARIGIDAPEKVQILRGEIAPQMAEIPDAERDDLFKQIHDLRDRLNLASVSASFAKKLLDANRIDDARHAMGTILEAVQASNSTAGHPGTTIRDGRPRTLLVEDNANERQLMAGLLRASGFDVEVAGDGAEALDHLSGDFRPDVVLMDMMMPECDGPTAVRRIRSTPAFQGIKIYAISGSSPSDVGLETGPRGVDRWYSKPLDPDSLLHELTRELIAKR